MTGRVLFAPRGISLKTTQTARRPTPLRSREASPVPHRRFGPLAERQAETAIPPGGSSRETPSPGRLTHSGKGRPQERDAPLQRPCPGLLRRWTRPAPALSAERNGARRGERRWAVDHDGRRLCRPAFAGGMCAVRGTNRPVGESPTHGSMARRCGSQLASARAHGGPLARGSVRRCPSQCGHTRRSLARSRVATVRSQAARMASASSSVGMPAAGRSGSWARASSRSR